MKRFWMTTALILLIGTVGLAISGCHPRRHHYDLPGDRGHCGYTAGQQQPESHP